MLLVWGWWGSDLPQGRARTPPRALLPWASLPPSHRSPSPSGETGQSVSKREPRGTCVVLISSLCSLPISSFLHLNQGEPRPPCRGAVPQPVGSEEEGEAGQPRRLSSRLSTGLGLHVALLPTRVGMADRCETARLGSNTTWLPWLTENLPCGQRHETTTLFPSATAG